MKGIEMQDDLRQPSAYKDVPAVMLNTTGGFMTDKLTPKKVKGKQKTYRSGKWTIKVPRKGSKLDRELEAEKKRIKSGKAKYMPLEDTWKS
jgi:hypothetical protein